jgi:hypothetical protein
MNTRLHQHQASAAVAAKQKSLLNSIPASESGDLVQGQQLPLQLNSPAPVTDFVKVEANLASFGFFTPSSKRIRATTSKVVTMARMIGGKKVKVSATIVPAAIYGLPVTADQDKYLALMKLISEMRRRAGKISNPVAFSSAELLSVLGKNYRSGKNYKEVSEWLDVMAATTIISEGLVYLAGRRTWARDRFRVFERAVSYGQEIETGVVADKNFVWLHAWQIENINNNHLLPVDLETYRQLRNHIAKALVPLLQVWLYASRDQGYFSKRYAELCDILSLRPYSAPSRIRQQLAPSLDELKGHEYLEDWALEPTSDGAEYKVTFRHGQKFHRDRQARLAAAAQGDLAAGESEAGEFPETLPILAAVAEAAVPPSTDLLAELKRRGIHEGTALALLESAAPGQPILDQLEYGDAQLARSPEAFRNPPGFYIYLVRDNVPVPQSFEPSRVREARARADEERSTEEAAYADYHAVAVRVRLEALSEEDRRRRLREKREEVLKRLTVAATWSPEALDSYAEASLYRDLGKEPPLLSFEEFRRRRQASGTAPGN